MVMTIPVDLSKPAEVAQQRPDVALVWPPHSESVYSLIVDGQAVVAGAVLHRPAPSRQPAAPGACGSDCVEIA
jgi:hypothetical protein